MFLTFLLDNKLSFILTEQTHLFLMGPSMPWKKLRLVKFPCGHEVPFLALDREERTWAVVFRTKINSPDVTIYLVKLIPCRKNHNHNSTGISQRQFFGLNEYKPTKACFLTYIHQHRHTHEEIWSPGEAFIPWTWCLAEFYRSGAKKAWSQGWPLPTFSLGHLTAAWCLTFLPSFKFILRSPQRTFSASSWFLVPHNMSFHTSAEGTQPSLGSYSLYIVI